MVFGIEFSPRRPVLQLRADLPVSYTHLSGAVSFLQISAPEMDDRMLTELLDPDSGLLVSLHTVSYTHLDVYKRQVQSVRDKLSADSIIKQTVSLSPERVLEENTDIEAWDAVIENNDK